VDSSGGGSLPVANVACRGVSKRFGTVQALRGVSFEVTGGGVALLVGPSGSGKTTLLRVIAGLEWPDAGEVLVGGEVMTGSNLYVPPHKRRLAFLFQRPTLWPHLNSRDNVALALVGQGIGRSERRRRADAALAELGMAARARAYPATLSGGEMQRVSLARALVAEPSVLLLDEPFAALDGELRDDIASRLAALNKKRDMTIVWVTHRGEDAAALRGKVFTLRAGQIEPHEMP